MLPGPSITIVHYSTETSTTHEYVFFWSIFQKLSETLWDFSCHNWCTGSNSWHHGYETFKSWTVSFNGLAWSINGDYHINYLAVFFKSACRKGMELSLYLARFNSHICFFYKFHSLYSWNSRNFSNGCINCSSDYADICSHSIKFYDAWSPRLGQLVNYNFCYGWDRYRCQWWQQCHWPTRRVYSTRSYLWSYYCIWTSTRLHYGTKIS